MGWPLLVVRRGRFERNPGFLASFWVDRASSDLDIIEKSASVLPKRLPDDFFPSGFGFEGLPPAVASGVAMLMVRRHLAGIPPFLCGGLPYGYWDDCYAPSSIVPMSWDMVRCLLFLMFARDVARVRIGLDVPPEGLPAIHQSASAIMEADSWTVRSAVERTLALEAACDPFFGPRGSGPAQREARAIVAPYGDESWIARYGTLCA